eukprot:5769886-Pleurochrysis_carterae.AAC.2
MAVCPAAAASCSGVRPSAAAALTSTFHWRWQSRLTAATAAAWSPTATARWSGVCPRQRMAPLWAPAAARCSGRSSAFVSASMGARASRMDELSESRNSMAAA